MWKEQLENFSSAHEEVTVHHALSREPSWNGVKGRINREVLEGFVGSEKEEGISLACICGPIPFIKDADR